MLKHIINISDFDEGSRLCCKCISDHYLNKKICSEGQIENCSFCDNFRPTFSLGEIVELVRLAFVEHFERTSPEPSDWDYFRIKELDYDWEREGTEIKYVIAEVAGIDEDIAEIVVKLLEERHSDWDNDATGIEADFARESHYLPKQQIINNPLQEKWSLFEEQLQTESRFINSAFQQTLNSVFKDIHEFKTREGKSVIENIGPKTSTETLFRARVFQNFEKLTEGLSYPAREVGPPPIGKASAGRMNATGISVFYGAFAQSTAIAEVRPPVGSDVVVAAFEIVRPLRVLNLSALRQIIIRNSYFDPNCRPLKERVAFLDLLSNKMTRPVMPEREHTDYLVTQVIADYLAVEHKLDGILYPSVQVASGLASADRTNIVLFHQASRVENTDPPPTASIRVNNFQQDEDGDDSEFVVFEDIPKQPVKDDSYLSDFPDYDFGTEDSVIHRRFHDRRQSALKLKMDTIAVHHVKAVQFTTKELPVSRASKGT